MTIVTKFDVNSNIWFMEDNKPKEAKVRNFWVNATSASSNKPEIRYFISAEQHKGAGVLEADAFESKAALLASL